MMNPASGPQVPGSAQVESSSILRAAQSLRQEQVNPRDMNASILAMQDFGEAVAGLAKVPQSFSEKLFAAQNAADIARADVIMREAQASYQQKMLDLPEDKWVEGWGEELGKVRERIAGIGLSQAAQAQLGPDLMRWESATAIQIGTQSVKQRIDRNRQAIDNAVMSAELAGDFGLALKHIDEGVRTNLLLPEEGEARKIKIEERQIEKNRIAQEELISADIAVDPKNAVLELEKAEKGEKGKYEGLDPVRARRLKGVARREEKYQKADTRRELHAAILNGEITDKATLESRAGGVLDAVEIRSLEKTMGQEISFDPEAVSKLRTQIKSYDGAQDQDMRKYNEIVTAIETTIPQHLQGPLASEINQVWNATARESKSLNPKQKFAGSLMSVMDRMGDDGIFGPTGKDKKGNIVSPEQHMETWSKVETAKEEMRAWLENDPTADPAKAMEKMRSVVGADAANAAAKGFDLSKPTGGWGLDYLENITRGPSPMPMPFMQKTKAELESASKMTNLTGQMKEMEGFSEKAYWDSGQWSIGYGTKAKSKDEVITREEAESRLQSELGGHRRRIIEAARKYGHELTENQLLALTSFDYNTGAGPSVLSSKDMATVRNRIGLYVYSDKNDQAPTSGLVNRRKKEIELFDTP